MLTWAHSLIAKSIPGSNIFLMIKFSGNKYVVAIPDLNMLTWANSLMERSMTRSNIFEC